MKPPPRTDFPLHRRQYTYVFAGFVVAAMFAASAGALASAGNSSTTRVGGVLLYGIAGSICLYCSAWIAGDLSHRAFERAGWTDLVRGGPIALAGCTLYAAALLAIWTASLIVFVLGPLAMFG